jgi:hypothetical protein
MKISIFVSFFTAVCFFAPGSVFADGMENASSSYKDVSKRARMSTASHSHTHKKKNGKETRSLSEFELAKYQYCGQDSDCTVSFNGCCDCANGSPEVAVNKARLEDFRSRFQCLSVACGTVDANPHCGNGVVTCVSHRCQYYK